MHFIFYFILKNIMSEVCNWLKYIKVTIVLFLGKANL